MRFALYENDLVTVEDFRLRAGADYQARKIYPYCPDCGASVAPHRDEMLRNFITAAQGVCAPNGGAYFSHFPNQADPDCRFLNSDIDPKTTIFSNGLNRKPVDVAAERRRFVTEDGRLTQGGYWAGLIMAGVLGKGLDADKSFYGEGMDMLRLGIIPKTDSKLWRRRSPPWAYPFVWLLFNNFPIKKKGGGIYYVQFKLNVPDGSILDANGKWIGKPASIVKVFQSSGQPVGDPSNGYRPMTYAVTEDNAFTLASTAMGWGNLRPFARINPRRLDPERFFTNVENGELFRNFHRFVDSIKPCRPAAQP